MKKKFSLLFELVFLLLLCFTTISCNKVNPKKCKHNYEIIEKVEATCVTDGLISYKCSICNNAYEEVIGKLGHDLVHHEKLDPICEEAGHEAYDTCTRCDYTTFKEISAIGHTSSEWIIDKDSNCTEDGSKHKECTVCHKVLETEVIVKLGHDFVHHEKLDPTCEEAGHEAYDTCTRCDYTTFKEIPATGHTSSDWIIDKESNCTEDGSKHKECTTCHKVLETEVIGKLGHDLVHHEKLDPICEEAGHEAYDTCTRCDYTTFKEIPTTGHTTSDWIVDVESTCIENGSKHKECTVCHKVLETEVIEKLGHDLVHHEKLDPICEETGHEAYDTCTRCDYTTFKGIPATGHTTSEWIIDKDSNCTEDGSKHKECTVCHKVLETEVINKLGHDFVHHEKLDPTCEEVGHEEYDTCTRCDYTTFKEIPATGHTSSEWIVDVEPTCINKGFRHKECITCYKNLITELINSLGHDLVHHEKLDPTCEEAGHEAYDTCTRCDYTTFKEIPAIGHTTSEWIIDKDSNCTEDGSKHKECTVCHKVLETEVINKLGHDFVHHEKLDPTCEEVGHEEYDTCTRCDYTTFKGISATGHTTSDWIIDQESNCTENGSKHKECTICNKVLEKEVIEKLGHDLVHHEAKEPTFDTIGWNSYDTCTRCDYTTYEELPMKERTTPDYLSMSVVDDENNSLTGTQKMRVHLLQNNLLYDWTVREYYGDYYGKENTSVDYGNTVLSKLTNLVDIKGNNFNYFCTNKNGDVVIKIKFWNPDNCEILSFTLNGVKYQTGMSCWDMTDMETLLLTINVGDAEGILDYTIDAIKYIDGTRIKDVRMIGNRHVYMAVHYDEKPVIKITNVSVGINSLKLLFNVSDNKKLISLSNGKIICALYDGNSVIDYADVTSLDNISFNNLIPGTNYQYSFIGYYDDFDGNGFTPKILQSGYIVTEDAVLFDDIKVDFSSISYKFKWNELINNGSIKSISLYDANDTLINDNVDSLEIATLSPDTEYKVLVNYSYDEYNGSIYLYFKTKLSKIVETEDYTYKLFADKTAEIIKYKNYDINSLLIPSVVVDNGNEYVITKIGENAFENHEEIEYINFPDNLEIISSYAFYGCPSIKYIIFPDNLKTVSSYAFYDTKNLDFLYLPKSIKTMGSNVFFSLEHTTYLSSTPVLFGFNVSQRTLSWVRVDSTFYPNSTSFEKNLIAQRTVKAVSKVLFDEERVYALCEAYNINYEYGEKHAELVRDYSGSNEIKIQVQNINDCDLTTISSCAFYQNEDLITIDISNNITKIGIMAFEGCINLRNVNMSNGVTTINADTFKDCNSLRKIDLLKNIEYIDSYAFANCSSLDYVYLDNIIYIGESAFENCTSLKNLTIDRLYFEEEPNKSITLDTHAFYGCNSLVRLNLPKSVNNISIDAFAGCVNLGICSLYERRPDFYDSYFDSDFGGSAPIIWGAFMDDNGICYTLKNGHARVVDFFLINNYETLFQIKNEIIVTSYGNEITYTVTAIDNGAFIRLGSYSNAFNSYVIIPESVNYISDDFKSYNFKYAYQNELVENDELIGIILEDKIAIIRCKADRSINSITIPSYINGIEVEYIFDGAFNGYYNLIEIINNSCAYNDSNLSYDMKHEGSIFEYNNFKFAFINGDLYLFDYLGNEENIILPDGVNGMRYSIHQNAFKDRMDIKSITIPGSVIKIDDYAFQNCLLLKSVTIQNGVEELGSYIFNNCINLENVLIGEDVNNLSDSQFNNCNKLKYNEFDNGLYLGTLTNPYIYLIGVKTRDINSLIINENTKEICWFATSGCTNLVSVTIPYGVKRIMDYAFSSSKSLPKIIIPDSVIYIGEYAFNTYGCQIFYEYENCYYLGDNENPYRILYKVKDETITNCVINESTKVINDSAFLNCSNLTEIIIPNSVTIIGSGAFYGCNKLISISLSNNLTYIKNNAFLECSSLREIIIPDSVTKIEKMAFYNCTSLKTIKLSNNLTSIEDTTFFGCSSLEKIIIPDNVKKIGSGVFDNCSNLQSVVLSTNLIELGDNSFNNCSSLKEIIIPDSVTRIGVYAFYGCINLQSIVLSANLKELEDYTFAACTNLVDVVVPDSVIYIGSHVFYYCKNLQTIVLSTNLLSIGYEAFGICTSLKEVVIPDSVKKICKTAFDSCSGLLSLTIGASLEKFDKSFVKDSKKLVEIINNSQISLNKDDFVNVVSIHQGSSNLSKYNDYYFLVDGEINYLVDYLGNDSEVILPDDFNGQKYVINKYAFISDKITFVKTSDGVTEIKEEAFIKCTNLTTFVLSKSVIKIGKEIMNKDCKVYYCGTDNDKSKISIDWSWNKWFYNMYIYHETQPTGYYTVKYWHYVDGNIVEW